MAGVTTNFNLAFVAELGLLMMFSGTYIMNVDLTKGTLANVLVIGLGSVFAFAALFNPSWLALFSDPTGYLVAFLFGFALLPYLKIRETNKYFRETYSVIDQAGRFLVAGGLTEVESKRLARPAYDLFLREIPFGDRVIVRIHDLGQQVRFMYAISRLFTIFSLLVGVALVVKLVCMLWFPNLFPSVLTFVSRNVFLYLLLLAVIILLVILGRDFERRAQMILERQRNMERILVLKHQQYFHDLGVLLASDKEAIRRLFNVVDATPNLETQP